MHSRPHCLATKSISSKWPRREDPGIRHNNSDDLMNGRRYRQWDQRSINAF